MEKRDTTKMGMHSLPGKRNRKSHTKRENTPPPRGMERAFFMFSFSSGRTILRIRLPRQKKEKSQIKR